MNKTELTYRNVQRKDVPAMFKLGKTHFGSPKQYSWDWSEKKVKAYTNSSFGSGIVCNDEDRLVGFALAQNKYSEQKPDVAWLTYVIVSPEYKGKGIGKTLTTKLTEILKKKGTRNIVTDIYEDNVESLEFFKRQGYAIKERWFILARKI